MSKYLCEKCKWNNNGWCKVRQFNGLKKKNIQGCDKYKEAINTGDEHLDKLLEYIEKENNKLWDRANDKEFWDKTEDRESSLEDLLDVAMHVTILQESAIELLREKLR